MLLTTEFSTQVCGAEAAASIFRPRNVHDTAKITDLMLYLDILDFAVAHYTKISQMLESSNAAAPFASRTFMGGSKCYIAPYEKEVEDFVIAIMTVTSEAGAYPEISRSMYYVANCDNADAPLEAHLIINKMCAKRDNLWDLVKCCLTKLQTLVG